MNIKIDIEGPAGCGKTRIAKAIEDFLEDALQDYPAGKGHDHTIGCRSTNVPQPQGVDTRPLSVWNTEFLRHV